MFFINERLTLKQREEFNSWGIMQPFFGFGRVISEEPLKPRYWTVDKEREIYLLNTSYDRDYPDEHVFIFIWNKKDYRVQFYRRLEKDGVIVWELPKKYEWFLSQCNCVKSLGRTPVRCRDSSSVPAIREPTTVEIRKGTI